MIPEINEQMDIIRLGAVEIIPEDELVKKIEKSIKTGKPLRIKLGCDPSSSDLHIGHAVILNKLRQFQDIGHTAVLIIGDFTGMIGDPTGRNKTRPQLTIEETKINGETYLQQATLILSKDSLEVYYNSEWLSKLSFSDVIKLSSNYTVAQMLERDDFTKRYKSGTPIGIHEFMYPLAQAMDSVAINSDVELGGTDQKFNLLVGREVQKAYEKSPQCILTMPLLEGTDGIEKMSKSYNNYVALTDTPREIFGKVMSVPDNITLKYYILGGFPSPAEANEMEKGLADGSLHPRNAKVKTAMAIVAKYHGEQAAKEAFEEFERIFVNKDIPDVIDEITVDAKSLVITDLLVLTGLAPSKKESRRLIEQGGVSVDNEKIEDPYKIIDLTAQILVKVGKRKFLKISGK